MEEQIRELKDELKEQSKKVNRLNNIAWVLGILIGVFGIGGSVLFNSLATANKEINKLNTEIANSETSLLRVREIQEQEILIFADSIRKDFYGDLSTRVGKLTKRVNGIKLVASDAGAGTSYVCGNEQRSSPTELIFMSGLRDGTSCGVTNLNYYKRISLVIPN